MDTIYIYINQGKYEKAYGLIDNHSYDEIKPLLLNEAYKTENIGIYSFVNYLIEQTGNICWIELAIELLLNPLCSIEGAYGVALYHARRLLSVSKSAENYERLLFFYELPETLLEKSEALVYATELLELNPGNKIALRVLNE